MPLRQFLYYDEPLVDDFLGELEGGISDEETQRDSSSRGRKIGGRAGGGPVHVSAGGERGSSTETERIVRQVRASKFQRLHDLLLESEPPLLKTVDYELDAELWDQLRRGDLIDVDAALSIPTISRLTATSGGFAGLLSLMETLAPDKVDDEAREAMEGFKALGQLNGGDNDQLTLVGELAVSPDFRVICPVRKRHLVGSLDDLETEVTVVAKIQRKVKPGDSEFVGDFPGLSLMDRDTRRAFIREQRRDSDPMTRSMFVEGPAATLSVLAIYR